MLTIVRPSRFLFSSYYNRIDLKHANTFKVKENKDYIVCRIREKAIKIWDNSNNRYKDFSFWARTYRSYALNNIERRKVE